MGDEVSMSSRGTLDGSGELALASVTMRTASAWATVAAYGVVAFPMNLALSMVDTTEVVSQVVFSLVAFAVSVLTYLKLGGDIGKRVAGLKSLSFPSLEPIGLGQSVVRSLYLLLFGLGSVIDTVVGLGEALPILMVVAYFVVNTVSIALTDRNQSLSELLTRSVTVDLDPD